jgi:hypothetical protein
MVISRCVVDIFILEEDMLLFVQGMVLFTACYKQGKKNHGQYFVLKFHRKQFICFPQKPDHFINAGKTEFKNKKYFMDSLFFLKLYRS